MAEEPRPPYVEFQIRPEEDRDATIAAGHYVAKDVVFAYITPSGTRDRVEKVADEWIKGLEEAVKNERFPEAWLHAYKKSLANFLESRENPVDGTPITNWPAVSPAQSRTLLDMNIRTIEDVAVMTEEAVQRLGMGARAIKEKARAWLEASKDTGKVSEQLAAIQQENADLRDRNETLMARLEKLEAIAEANVKPPAKAKEAEKAD